MEPSHALGRYLVFDEIASGGMATVHFGRLSGPAGFSRVVAIKRLHPNYAKDPDFVSMILDEARLAARIRHPNVVATLDMVATGSETFLVMEYVHGESLAKLWRATAADGKHMDPRIVATVMSGVLHGLHAAHEARGERGESLDIVHRDVSPQNILVGGDGVARVLDFGVAKAAGRVQTTREGRIKGKLAYMPPEQLHGATVTRRTDIYAAAVVTWELLTGKRAFGSDHEAAIITAILARSLSPPSKVAPHVPAAFDAVVMRGLHRNPSRRYATAREMALDLERCVGIASMSEVAEWVQSHAHKDLVRRALRVRAIEVAEVGPNDPTLVASPREETTKRQGRGARSAAPPADETSGVSRIAVPSTLARLRRRRRERLVMGAATALAAVLGSVVLVRALSRNAAVTAARAAAESAVPAVAYGDHAERYLLVAAPATLPPLPAPPAASSAPLVERKVALPVRAARAAAPPAAHPPSRTRVADCEPPYTIDESGHKHYKAACLD
ncbi:MAG: serine/threonine protein kinase [Myxococcales bacterium]|nr:serine/threonine protein kinase [Myxococcales bacterium]